MSIYPPTLINKDYIAAMSSIKWGAAEKWLVRGPNIANAAQVLPLTPRGIETFNNTYQIASASLLNQFGTTETTTTQQTEPGFGKTPVALQMQAKRENTRDNADRFYMEQFLTKVTKKMVNLLAKKQPKAITVRLFGDEIEELKRSYPEIEELWDEKKGNLTVPKSKTGEILYDYEIVSGSTYMVDQRSQQENLVMLMQLFLQTPQLPQILNQEGYNLKFGELFKRIIANSGIQDWDKIIEELGEEEQLEGVLNQDAQRFLDAVTQLQGQQPNLNQVPPQEQPGGMVQGQPGGVI